MSLPIFITGTSTNVGKTTVACAFMRALQQHKYSVLGIKPIASGCEKWAEGLRNSDALLLQAAASIKVDYSVINPLAFEPAIAPHIAAQQVFEPLSVMRVQTLCQPALTAAVDILVIEGAGGWLVPLNSTETMADLVQVMQWPVILVVGMQLGCINHALLTVTAIRAAGIPLLGWVANFIEPEMEAAAENLLTLQSCLPAPCLAVIPFGNSVTAFDMNKINSIFSEVA